MEIRIDTKRDSVDDIKKAIKFLQEFIKDSGGSFEQSEMPSGAFSMFSDDNTTKTDESSKDDDDDNVQINPVIEPY